MLIFSLHSHALKAQQKYKNVGKGKRSTRVILYVNTCELE